MSENRIGYFRVWAYGAAPADFDNLTAALAYARRRRCCRVGELSPCRGVYHELNRDGITLTGLGALDPIEIDPDSGCTV